jgi:two-component system sensor kinase FixL
MPEPVADVPAWKNDQLFRALIATAVDGMVVIDTRGTIQLYNQACENLFGYGPDEIIGQNVKLLMPAPYRREHDRYLSNYRDTGHKRIIGIGREVVGQRKDLTTFPMYLSVGEGEVDGKKFFVGIIRDLTELRRESARGEEANRLLAQVVQSSNDAIISKTLDGMITSWNASAQRMFGYGATEAIGKNITILFPPDRMHEEQEILERLRAGKETKYYETARRHKNGGEVLISLSVAPILDHDGHVIGASDIARDITEQKQAEANTLKLQNELAHVARLSAMGQMSAAIAHELNQPLTAVANYVRAAQRMLSAENASPRQLESAREAMEKAAGQTIRAGTIIRYLRDFVEKRDSEKSAEDLNRVVQQAVTLGLVGTTHSNVKVSMVLDQQVPPVMMDKVQIQQVLINLIRNSVEAMASSPHKELAFSSQYVEPDFARIVVRDSGPGLPAEISAKLFQPFITTKDKGMGIGLNICQSIVEAHGGTIRVLKDEAAGTAFEIMLPLAHPDDLSGSPPGSDHAS